MSIREQENVNYGKNFTLDCRPIDTSKANPNRSKPKALSVLRKFPSVSLSLFANVLPGDRKAAEETFCKPSQKPGTSSSGSFHNPAARSTRSLTDLTVEQSERLTRAWEDAAAARAAAGKATKNLSDEDYRKLIILKDGYHSSRFSAASAIDRYGIWNGAQASFNATSSYMEIELPKLEEVWRLPGFNPKDPKFGHYVSITATHLVHPKYLHHEGGQRAAEVAKQSVKLPTGGAARPPANFACVARQKELPAKAKVVYEVSEELGPLYRNTDTANIQQEFQLQAAVYKTIADNLPTCSGQLHKLPESSYTWTSLLIGSFRYEEMRDKMRDSLGRQGVDTTDVAVQNAFGLTCRKTDYLRLGMGTTIPRGMLMPIVTEGDFAVWCRLVDRLEIDDPVILVFMA